MEVSGKIFTFSETNARLGECNANCTSVYYYRAKRKDDSEVIEQLSILAELHRTWVFWMMYHRLRKLKYMWNHKRVYNSPQSLDRFFIN